MTEKSSENSQKSNVGHVLFITGAAGYVGAMLVDQFSKRADVLEIICLDKEEIPELLKENGKIFWIKDNTSHDTWQRIVAERKPDIVIHTAWQIRPLYGEEDKEWKWNVDGSTSVFRFALGTPSIKKLIHFSTASIYGAYPKNTLEHYFKEEEPPLEDIYPYGVQKKKVEENLRELIGKAGKGKDMQVSVVRPAAITGPRGHAMTNRFGLQASLSGNLKGSIFYPIIKAWVFRVPATAGWVRQFIHEDDITDIITRLTFGETSWALEIFNLAPPGAAVRPEDMARAVGKKVLWIYPWMVRLAFFWVRHITRGAVPTARGSWKFYSYPIVMDGTKITKTLGYKYRYESQDAFVKKEGRYSSAFK